MKIRKEKRAARKKKSTQDTPVKIRCQFDFSQAAVAQLDEMKEMTGASTRAEVLRNALVLFYSAITVQLDGGKFGFLDNKGNLSWYILPGVKREKAEKRNDRDDQRGGDEAGNTVGGESAGSVSDKEQDPS
jgi:hypothetical protein